MTLLKLLVPLSLALLLNACSYKPVELKNVSSVEVIRMDQDSISVRVGVVLNNPNNYKITLTDPDFDLFVNNNKIGKAVFYQDLVLEKNIEKEYIIPVAAGFDGKYASLLLSSLGGILTGKMMIKGEGTVVGKAWFFKKQVPFEFEEDINSSMGL